MLHHRPHQISCRSDGHAAKQAKEVNIPCNPPSPNKETARILRGAVGTEKAVAHCSYIPDICFALFFKRSALFRRFRLFDQPRIFFANLANLIPHVFTAELRSQFDFRSHLPEVAFHDVIDI